MRPKAEWAINSEAIWARGIIVLVKFQQVAGNPRWGRFTIETPLQRERGLEIQREQRRIRDSINISRGR